MSKLTNGGDRFEEARRHVERLVEMKAISLSMADKQILYGLFKQATEGDVRGDVPNLIFQPAKRTKYNAWAEQIGKSKEMARAEYIAIVERLDPKFVVVIQDKTLLSESSSTTSTGSSNNINGFMTPSKQKKKNEEKEGPAARMLLESLTNGNGVDLRTPARIKNRTSDQVRLMLLSPIMGDTELGNAALRVVESRSSLSRERVFTSVGNVRDLGGLPALTADGLPGRIKFNRVLRAAQLDEISEIDAAYLLDVLNIKTLIDLRPLDITTKKHSGGILDNKFTVCDKATSEKNPGDRVRVRIPIPGTEACESLAMTRMSLLQTFAIHTARLVQFVIGFFRRLTTALPGFSLIGTALESFEAHVTRFIFNIASRAFARVSHSELYAQVMKTEIKPLRDALVSVSEVRNHPAIFYCDNGRDRTGIVTSLVLYGCGVPRKEILREFYLSSINLKENASHRRREESKALDSSLLVRAPKTEQEEEAIRKALESVERENGGSLDAYLEHRLGINPSNWYRSLREALVERV